MPDPLPLEARRQIEARLKGTQKVHYGWGRLYGIDLRRCLDKIARLERIVEAARELLRRSGETRHLATYRAELQQALNALDGVEQPQGRP